jgi:hypothetical protein
LQREKEISHATSRASETGVCERFDGPSGPLVPKAMNQASAWILSYASSIQGPSDQFRDTSETSVGIEPLDPNVVRTLELISTAWER